MALNMLLVVNLNERKLLHSTYKIFILCILLEGKYISTVSIFRLLFVGVKKSSFHYTRAITPKRATSGEVHLCGLAPGQRCSGEKPLRWRAVGDTTSHLIGPGIKPQASRTDIAHSVLKN